MSHSNMTRRPIFEGQHWVMVYWTTGDWLYWTTGPILPKWSNIEELLRMYVLCMHACVRARMYV